MNREVVVLPYLFLVVQSVLAPGRADRPPLSPAWVWREGLPTPHRETGATGPPMLPEVGDDPREVRRTVPNRERQPVEGAAPYAVVLGTAQDAGHPQMGCSRACCADAWDAGGHLVSAIGLVDPDSGQHWLLDATPDLPRQQHLLPGTLAGILPTHAHIGHYTGLMYLGREAMGAQQVPVWVMPRMATFLSENGPWKQLVELQNVVLRPIPSDGTIELSPSLSVTAITVPHRDEYSETVGFVVRGPSKSVLYLPDIDKWDRWADPIEELVASVDQAWVDGTFYDGDELPGRDMAQIPHPFIVESMARFAGLPPATRDRIHFIHLNHTNPALRADSSARASIEAAGLHVAEQGQRFAL